MQGPTVVARPGWPTGRRASACRAPGAARSARCSRSRRSSGSAPRPHRSRCRRTRPAARPARRGCSTGVDGRDDSAPTTARPPAPRRARPAGRPEQVRPALLLLARVAGQLHDERLVESGQVLERAIDLVDRRERVQPLAPRSAAHPGSAALGAAAPSRTARRRASSTSTSVATWRYFTERAPWLACTRRAKPASRSSSMAAPTVDLVELQHRVAAARLVAGRQQGVQRQRIGGGDRHLLLEQAPEHPARVRRQQGHGNTVGGRAPAERRHAIDGASGRLEEGFRPRTG